MVVPTTVLPPAVDELDIQALANVPMPVVQAAPPRLSPYSASSLPSFFQQRVGVAPGLFGPQQGLLGAAPVGAPADYGALEQKFVESFAARPEYFGRSYTPGAMMPGRLEFSSLSTSSPLSLEDGLKTAAMLKAAYELRNPLEEKIFDPLQEKIIEPFADQADDYFFEPIKENIIEPFSSKADDYFFEPIKENIVEPFADKIDDSLIEPIKLAVVDPIVADIKKIIPEGTGTAIQEAKDKFLNEIDVRFNLGTGETIDKLKKTFEGVSDAVGYIGDVENALTKPSAQSMKNALNAVESLDMLFRGQEYLPGGSIRGVEIPGVGELTDMTTEVIADKKTGDIIDSEQVISNEVANSLILAASAFDVVNFAKDPSVEAAPSAYVSASEISKYYTDTELPGVNSPYVQGPLAAANIFNAAKALEGGLDTPGEVGTVVSAIPSGLYLGSLGASALGATQAASQLGTLSGLGKGQHLFGKGSIGGPLMMVGLTLAAPALIEGGAAGEIPRSKYTLGFEDGRFGETGSRAYDRPNNPIETAKRDFGFTQSRNAIDFVNWLQNSMGYEVDQTALKKWEASDQDEIVDQYGYFEKRHRLEDPSVNAADFVTNMLQAGVLKPTAETPPINMQAALNVLNPQTTYYSDLRDIQVAGNVNVPYLLGQINPYPEGYDQTTGQLITPEMQESVELATAYAQREPAPPQTIGEFIGSITPQEAMALPAGVDFGQVMPDIPGLGSYVTLSAPFDPGKRQQAITVPRQMLDFQTLQRMLPV